MSPAEINAALFALWNKFGNPTDPYVPLVCGQPQRNSMVFVGFNPSFSDTGWKELVGKWVADGRTWFDPTQLFGWHKGMTPADFNAQLSLEVADFAKRHYDYFAPFRSFAASVNLEWEHLDLFAYQATKQEDAEKRLCIKKKDAATDLNEFSSRQMDLFRELLVLAQPRAIIVVNARASHLYFSRWRPAFDSARGCYLDHLNAASVPVFFSGMLSGQRSLDVFSRDRLFWLVAKELGKQWSPPQERLCGMSE